MPTDTAQLCRDPVPTVLMTRPRAASEQFVAALRAQGHRFDVCLSPLFDIVHLSPDVTLDGARGVIFSSANGVAAWVSMQKMCDLPAYTVGSATAVAARDAGFEVRIIAQDAADLVAQMLTQRVCGPILHLAGLHRRGNISEKLSASGIPTTAVVVYDQPQIPLSDAAQALLMGQNPIIVPVFSPRTANLLAQSGGNAPLHVAAMSEAVAFNLAPLHIVSQKVAARPDSSAMLEAVSALLTEAQAHYNENRRACSPADRLKG